MVTKAIVEEIISEYQVRVRVPFYNSIKGASFATPTEDLSIAAICTLPNTYNTIHLGDIVFVSFEDNDISKPVVLGILYKEDGNIDTNNMLDMEVKLFKTHSTTILSEDTTIGNVTPFEIRQLGGVKDNIQAQLDALDARLKELETT